MLLGIKDQEALGSILCGFDTKLIEIVLWVVEEYDRLMITCGYRKGDTGVHGTTPCRGIDLRSWVYSTPKNLVQRINTIWEYDSNRPKKTCAMLHDTGSGVHIHLQVHGNTRKR